MLNVHSLFHRSMRRISSEGAPARPGGGDRPEVRPEAPERRAWQYAGTPSQREGDGMPLRVLGVPAQLGA